MFKVNISECYRAGSYKFFGKGAEMPLCALFTN